LQVRLLPRASCPARPWAPIGLTPPAAHAPAAESRRIRHFFVESCTSVVAAWPLAEPAFQSVQPLRRVPAQAAVKPLRHTAPTDPKECHRDPEFSTTDFRGRTARIR